MFLVDIYVKNQHICLHLFHSFNILILSLNIFHLLLKLKQYINKKKRVRKYCTIKTNIINKKNDYTDLTLNNDVRLESIKLNPWFVTGLTDGSLYIVLRKDMTYRFGILLV